jgi:hypothetical protein
MNQLCSSLTEVQKHMIHQEISRQVHLARRGCGSRRRCRRCRTR